MFNKAIKETTAFKLQMVQNGTVIEEYTVDRDQLLIGRAENCDFTLNSPGISHYHAIIKVLGEDTLQILDLQSANGIYINGQPITQATLTQGDALRIGDIDFYLSQTVVENEIVQTEAELTVIRGEEEKPTELKPVEGLAVIDGEYCDIVFDETPFRPIDFDNLSVAKFKPEDFVDTASEHDDFEILKEKGSKAIQLTITCNHSILEQEHYDLSQKGKIYLTNGIHKTGKVFVPFELDKDHCLLEWSDRTVPKVNLPGDVEVISKSQELSEKEGIILRAGTIQIYLKVVDAPPSTKFAPFFGRDQEFKKKMAKVMGSFLAIMLLFITFYEVKKEEPKKLAVIYKRAPKKVEKKSLKKEANKALVQGTKNPQQKKQEVAKAKKGKPKKTPTKKVAQAKPAPSKAKPAPKKKTFTFTATNGLANLMKTKSTNAAVSNTEASVAATDVSVSTSKSSGQVTAENVGNLGTDSYGKKGSWGPKGINSKDGFDTAYAEAKTVVLGSMDPELLRKILQEHLPQFKHCYQQELEYNSDDLKGVIDLNFRIEPNGKVSKIDIKMAKAKFSRGGVDCMASVLKLIDFPRPKGGGVVDVRQPLNFFAEVGKI